MRDYKSGKWGFSLVWGLHASVFPRALVLALPNAILAFVIGLWIENNLDIDDYGKEDAKNAFTVWGGFTSVLFFILYFRSNVAYDRWWEGGTLLQQTRGEWFNAYSSLIAFSSTDPKMQPAVEKFHHLLARLMSLLFSCALQQVSPNKDRPLEIIDPTGIDPQSLMFLKESSDKVEVILQWIQRSTILNMASGVLPIAPPVMSRAFQEVSRGIVNLQNARKIADFPFPFPFAQTSIVMLLIHWAACPIVTCYLTDKYLASITCFSVVFFLWCINYIALQLEQPFGTDANDLPLFMMQTDWNKSVGTLLTRRAQHPPKFEFDAHRHQKLEIIMSDGTSMTKRRLTVPSGSITEDGLPRQSVQGVSKADSMRSNRSVRQEGPQRPASLDEYLDGADGAVAPDSNAAIPDGGGIAQKAAGTKPNVFFSIFGNLFNFGSRRGQELRGPEQHGVEDGFEDAQETSTGNEAEGQQSFNTDNSALVNRQSHNLQMSEITEDRPGINDSTGATTDGVLAAEPRRLAMRSPVGIHQEASLDTETPRVSPDTDGIPQILPPGNLLRPSVTAGRSSPGGSEGRQVGVSGGLTHGHIQVDIPDHAPGRPPESGTPDYMPGRPQSNSRQSQGNRSPEELLAGSLQDSSQPSRGDAPDVLAGRLALGENAVTSTNGPAAA